MPSQRPILESEFLEWKQHDCTYAFFKALKSKREVMKEDLVEGRYDNPEFARGKASALREILEMSYEEYLEAVNES